MSSSALWQLSARDAASAVRTGAVAATDLVEAVLRRIDEVGPAVNAVVDLMAEEAIEAAKEADAAVAAGEWLGPLHGVPVTVKINVDVAGRATTNGVVAFAEGIAARDSDPVRNLRAAGAIIVGRTNVPAFSTRYFTSNDLHGRTVNPVDRNLTPGGSSGGAAVAVATGQGPLAHGNDRAGSIRYPAYACGVFGLRPTTGRVSDFNPSAAEERGLMSQLSNVQGPLARTVDDLRLGLAALSQETGRDPWWAPVPLERSPTRTGKARVAVVKEGVGRALSSPVRHSLDAAAGWLSDAGHPVVEASPPDLLRVAELFWPVLMAEERGASEAERAASTTAIERFADEATRNTRAGTRVFARELDFSEYIRALGDRSALKRRWLAFLDEHPLVVMPVSADPPFDTDADQGGDDAVAAVLEANYPLVGISYLGLPSVAAPVGMHGGRPGGVQVVGRPYHEHECLEAGEVIEARLGGVATIYP